MSRTNASVLVALALSAGLSAASVLDPSRAAAQEMTVAQATQLLSASSPDEVRMGIETLGLLGSPQAAAPLSARIRQGLPPDLLGAAIDTLGILGRNEAGPVLFELLAHRRPEIRLRAVQAISTCAPRGADRALVSSLSDSSSAVRAAAAETLATLRATSAVPELFLAFEHDVLQAGPALAALARAEDVPRIVGYIGTQPFATLRPMLLTILQRTDLAARTRIDLVARLGELATAEVRTLLSEFIESLPANDNSPLRRAAEETMNRIAG